MTCCSIKVDKNIQKLTTAKIKFTKMTTNTSTKCFDETSQVDADSNNYSFF